MGEVTVNNKVESESILARQSSLLETADAIVGMADDLINHAYGDSPVALDRADIYRKLLAVKKLAELQIHEAFQLNDFIPKHA